MHPDSLSPKNKTRVVLLISGGGTTAEAIIQASQSDKLKKVEIVGVISSRAEAGGIAKAQRLDIPTQVINPQDYQGKAEFGEALLNACAALQIDVISQNGWLPLTPLNLIEHYEGKIINQHPGPLDPGYADFGGKGMYGARVTAAKIAWAWLTQTDAYTHATVHHVTDEYDKGNVITESDRVEFSLRPHFDENNQADMAALVEATPDVQQTLLTLEHQMVISALHHYSENGTFTQIKKPSRLIPEEKIDFLSRAKRIAIRCFPEG